MILSLIFAVIVLSVKRRFTVAFLWTQEAQMEGRHKTSQHGFPFPKADLAVTEFSHKRTDQ